MSTKSFPFLYGKYTMKIGQDFLYNLYVLGMMKLLHDIMWSQKAYFGVLGERFSGVIMVYALLVYGSPPLSEQNDRRHPSPSFGNLPLPLFWQPPSPLLWQPPSILFTTTSMLMDKNLLKRNSTKEIVKDRDSSNLALQYLFLIPSNLYFWSL